MTAHLFFHTFPSLTHWPVCRTSLAAGIRIMMLLVLRRLSASRGMAPVGTSLLGITRPFSYPTSSVRHHTLRAPILIPLTCPSTPVGTGVQLFGNISQFGTYDLQLDGQRQTSISTFSPSNPNLLADYTNLPAANHTLSLTFHNPTGSNQTLISIERVIILVEGTAGCVTLPRI